MFIDNFKKTKCINGCLLFNDNSNYLYWENNGPTEDEIETVKFIINKYSKNKLSILHIGIGNSFVASTLNRVHKIDGITISGNEIKHGKKLNITNYRIFFANKLQFNIFNKKQFSNYDIIIDVNLKSFSCCEKSFIKLFSDYKKMLKKNGIIITGIKGMRWSRMIKPVLRFSFKRFFYKRLKEFDGPKSNILRINECRNLSKKNKMNLKVLNKKKNFCILKKNEMFSIVIATFNNINYLKLCVKSIKLNSTLNHELIFHVQDGTDGSLEYIKSLGYKYTHSKNNMGLCYAYNKAVKISSSPLIVTAHDDMYFCKNWDKIFIDELHNITDEHFYLSGTMIQKNDGHINFDCGDNFKNFNEKKLNSNIENINFYDFQGTHWMPALIKKKTWDMVGGLDLSYGPGLGSDPDFNMKLWNSGVRLFKGLGKCKVYHFSSITLRKKVSNNGSKIFLLKWGMTIKFFKKYYLKTDTRFNGILTNPKKNFFYYYDLTKCKITFFYYKIINFFYDS